VHGLPLQEGRPARADGCLPRLGDAAPRRPERRRRRDPRPRPLAPLIAVLSTSTCPRKQPRPHADRAARTSHMIPHREPATAGFRAQPRRRSRVSTVITPRDRGGDPFRPRPVAWRSHPPGVDNFSGRRPGDPPDRAGEAGRLNRVSVPGGSQLARRPRWIAWRECTSSSSAPATSAGPRWGSD
jgi:hypothetical protein